jgi:hypothetical protein
LIGSVAASRAVWWPTVRKVAPKVAPKKGVPKRHTKMESGGAVPGRTPCGPLVSSGMQSRALLQSTAKWLGLHWKWGKDLGAGRPSKLHKYMGYMGLNLYLDSAQKPPARQTVQSRRRQARFSRSVSMAILRGVSLDVVVVLGADKFEVEHPLDQPQHGNDNGDERATYEHPPTVENSIAQQVGQRQEGGYNN